MFTFSSVSAPHPLRRFEEPELEKNLLLYLGLSPALLFDEQVKSKDWDWGGRRG